VGRASEGLGHQDGRHGKEEGGIMDDFLIAFGALWLVICMYAGLIYRIKVLESASETPQGPFPSYREETHRISHWLRVRFPRKHRDHEAENTNSSWQQKKF
jgi:hypothetical protein